VDIPAMIEIATQIILYVYPLWALVAFAMALVNLVTYFFVDSDLKTLLWGIVFLGWSIAFFGAGLLIAQAFDRTLLIPLIYAVWIVMLPVFVFTAGIECIRLWRILRKIDRGRS
jgi:hypothetical protein